VESARFLGGKSGDCGWGRGTVGNSKGLRKKRWDHVLKWALEYKSIILEVLLVVVNITPSARLGTSACV
jgi:hypothetical protein